MSKSLLIFARPWVCRECRTQIAQSIRHCESIRKASSATPSEGPTITRVREKPVYTVHRKDAGIAKIAEHIGAQTYKLNAEAVKRRIESLGGEDKVHELFPRWHRPNKPRAMASSEFSGTFAALPEEKKATFKDEAGNVTVYGRITSPRVFGKKLIFLNLTTSASYSSHLVGAPVKLEARNIFGDDESLTGQPDSLKVWLRTVQRGDWIAVTGKFATNQEGALSIIATELPTTLAPTLQPIPEDITDAEFRMHNRHADMIVHPRERDVIFIRQRILQSLRAFLNGNRFIEVNTPILQAGAGGAVARPFETTATEFSDLKLNLRVAPELFLKRLIIGGMPRVFEIGSAFRNEGLDATHNPEFTTCEFYSVMASLDNLMTLTETLFNRFAATAKQARGSMKMLPDLDHLFDSDTFARLEFIPTIEGAIRERSPEWTFPDLTSRDAQEKLFAVFDEFKVTKPASTNLPRLLDALAGHFIEPLCTKPTFITHHPECMSPLAKSFDAEPMTTSSISHRVSARAELFIESREYVNCYEEENSPLQQRRKFEDQLAYRAEDDGETSRGVDESYVGALEWGMPPTGGWGCGIDRIVMLFTGKSRIADVLPFGNLRNVVGLGNKEVKKNKVGISDEAKMLQETRRELEEAQTLLAELRQEVKDLREDALEGSG